MFSDRDSLLDLIHSLTALTRVRVYAKNGDVRSKIIASRSKLLLYLLIPLDFTFFLQGLY